MLVTGEKNTTGEESGSVGGQRTWKQLRPDRCGGDAASSFAMHSILARPPPQDVGSGSDARR